MRVVEMVEKPEYVVAVGFQKPKGNRSVGSVALPAFAEITRLLDGLVLHMQMLENFPCWKISPCAEN